MAAMKWSSALSEQPRLADAVRECAAALRAEIGAGEPDLLVAFACGHDAAALPAELRAAMPARHLIGCSAGGVVGGGREVEHRAALSLTAALLPGVDLRPFHVGSNDLPGESARPIPAAPADDPHFLLLADPFTFDAEHFLLALDAAFPAAGKIGGLASGGRQPGENALLLDAEVRRAGLVGMALTGNVTVDTVVAQGCRPIGLPMFVTACDRNVIQQLDGRPPRDLIIELYRSLGERDRELFQHSLFLGVAMRPHEQEYRQGDFLIRNVMGLDPESGFLAIGQLVEPQTVVQFHLRDAQTSHDDLVAMLTHYRQDQPGAAPAGALLFSCLGRGEHLYGRPDHDSEVFRERLGAVPLGGFFCNGEIGPVHGQTFLHGYTSSFGLFRPKR